MLTYARACAGVLDNASRTASIKGLRIACEALQELQKRVSEAVKQSRGHDSQADDRLLALESDVKGRMLKSVQGMDRFNRWGKHYLRAFIEP